jgi:hypothetical protein
MVPFAAAAAQSRTQMAPWSPPASYRPAEPYRMSPSRAPPGSQAFAQVPRSAPAFHNDPQPRASIIRQPREISGTVRSVRNERST